MHHRGLLSAAVLSCICILALPAAANPYPEQAAPGVGAQCVDCHAKITPNTVTDWKQSRHYEAGISCDTCHGSDHMSAADAAKAKIPAPETCGQCHDTQVAQFKKGKHAMAWAAMEAMPTIHWQPMAMTEGMKGCGLVP
jgi:formate-dependent nitrite reductase cytochrome c552 subunit